MKTVLRFDDGIDRRKAILHHSNQVHVHIETRKEHQSWKDSKGNPILNARYIVISYPNTLKVDLSRLQFQPNEQLCNGYLSQKEEDKTEILFYDNVTFLWSIYKLESTGLVRVTQRVIPTPEEGEIFPFYIDPKGIWQNFYDLFFGLIQLPFQWKASKKEKKEKKMFKRIFCKECLIEEVVEKDKENKCPFCESENVEIR